MYYLNNFFIFSIFGYLFETILFKTLNMHKESGFLYLWWTPFYGFGVIIINLIYNKLKNNKLLLYLTLFIILTILEFIGGYLLEMLYGYSLWTYESIPLHIGKYISIPTSLLWVLFSFIYIKFIKKYSDKLVTYIPKYLTLTLLIIFILDNIITISKIISIK